MTRAFRIALRNAVVYRSVWHGSMLLSFLQPTLFLTAMGLGLGRLVDRGPAALPGGVSYLDFLGPGLLAASCMQTGSFESSFPISGKMTWRRTYDAIMATPTRVIDIVIGELAWMAFRLFLVAVPFATVLAAFGTAPATTLIAAVPAAILTGLAFSAPMVAYAGHLDPGDNFNVVFRFVITPLFLFSGVFVPVSSLPAPLQAMAAATPLFHGVELTRGLVLHTLTARAVVVHVLYLCAMVAAGTAAAHWTFSRKLRA
jgi:lipooligosaccharide transport system permease protein